MKTPDPEIKTALEAGRDAYDAVKRGEAPDHGSLPAARAHGYDPAVLERTGRRVLWAAFEFGFEVRRLELAPKEA